MKVVVAGHTGLVGSAVYSLLEECGYETIGINSKVVDLLNPDATIDFLSNVKPDSVIDAAALVGGIGANNSFPVQFLMKNIQIQNNLLNAAHIAEVEKFVFLGSSCIYPRECPQPIKEDYFMSGKLESTNSAYALAKITGIELIKSFRKQYNKSWISLMPTNVYGPRDNFNLETGHVVASLIHKFWVATREDKPVVELWGTGSSRREFIHSEDLARAILVALEKYNSDGHLNVSTREEVTISELANLIADITGYRGEIIYDSMKPEGVPRRHLDSTLMENLGWRPQISLREGIAKTIDWFSRNQVSIKR